MRKIIIKLPKEKGGRFRLARKGWKGRRFMSAAGLVNRMERTFPRTEFREKTAIIVKEYHRGRYRNINETLASKDPKYLIFATGCFLEDYLSKEKFRNVLKKFCCE